MKELTKEEWHILLTVVNETAFKGQVAEKVVELKEKIKENIDS
jgi:hypothetical protein